MSRRRIAIAVLALLAVGLFARFVVWPARTPTVSPVEFVPQTWELARTAPMHDLHVGQKQIACARCHEAGFGKPPSLGACAASDCHAKPAANAHHGNDQTPTTCLTCHVFRGGAQATACVDCHGASAKTTNAGAPKHEHHATNDATCAKCHALHGDKGQRTRAVDCTDCHTSVEASHGKLDVHLGAGPAAAQMCTSCHHPHEGKAEAQTRCASCHVNAQMAKQLAAPQVSPQGRNVAGHPACTTCHTPHDAKKSDVKKCASCHAGHDDAMSNPGHAACTSCHQPHAPGGAAASCKGCHGDKSTLAANHVASHDACTSCHQPHRPQVSKENACASCHQAIAPKHPQDRACIGCHAPHAPASAPIAAACSSCHRKASSDHAFHSAKVECRQCHAPHDFQLASVRPNAAHPTMANVVATQFCSKCHASEASQARSGHQGCTNCHGEAHAPRGKPAGCATCHATEASTAPKGHATCTNCHDGHTGSLGSHQACTSCHSDKSHAQHGNLKNGCQTCHRPHGPNGLASPPVCTSCHAVDKLPGLHAIQQHAANCASCHSSHAAPSATRATCTGSCHADRRTHQPAAQVCEGCHLFR